eukprot:CAMPEP_0170607988 /NCGR_PEP_ID=MMETSP0224-20130122/21348_1 /TAXON_ID=285029 /ORGANISM="Togula jolla, Strain CCCM 725" /LENGTH=94 /DNA_ID=CAMNT_0010933191 /DNA_START=107 /DNA_END=390 /DNA_ORIENTATION=-
MDLQPLQIQVAAEGLPLQIQVVAAGLPLQIQVAAVGLLVGDYRPPVGSLELELIEGPDAIGSRAQFGMLARSAHIWDLALGLLPCSCPQLGGRS